MGDLFHEKVNSVYANAIWDIMQHQAPQHTYLVLTKRPDRMMKFLKWRHENQDNERRIRIAPNIWVGTTVEDRPNAETRLEYLLQCPAVLRFVSYEPALGTLIDPAHSDPEYLQLLSLIDWFICGSESGPGARWFNENWAREVKEFCVQAGKPFFFKQSRAGRKIIHLPELDGQIWDQTPAIGPHEGSWYIPGVICSPEGDPMTGKLYWKHSEPKIVNTQEMR
jgi:protein gp37